MFRPNRDQILCPRDIITTHQTQNVDLGHLVSHCQAVRRAEISDICLRPILLACTSQEVLVTKEPHLYYPRNTAFGARKPSPLLLFHYQDHCALIRPTSETHLASAPVASPTPTGQAILQLELHIECQPYRRALPQGMILSAPLSASGDRVLQRGLPDSCCGLQLCAASAAGRLQHSSRSSSLRGQKLQHPSRRRRTRKMTTG